VSQARQQAAERPGWSWPIHGWLRGARRSGGRVCALSDVLAWPPRVSRLFAGDVSFAARGRLSRKRWATSACGRRRRCLPRAPVACSEARRFHPLPLPPSKRVALGETLAFFRGRSGWPILQGGAFIGPCWRKAGSRLAVSSETVGAGATRGRLSRKRWAAMRGVGGAWGTEGARGVLGPPSPPPPPPSSKPVALGETLAFFRGRGGCPHSLSI
jgi:hypothetical protein